MFDKAALYAGPSAPTVTSLATTLGSTIVPAITLDNTVNNMTLVNNWNGSSGGNGFIRLYTITGTPAAPVFSTTMLFPSVTQPWADFPNGTGADFAPQNTVTSLIQNNDSRMQNAVFRNGSLWCTHTGFVPAAAPTHSQIQWWQVDPATGTVQQFGTVTDATATNFFAFPSIAVNAYNDVLLGYSSYSAAQFGSCNYSFRLHTDPANSMQPTVQFKAGAAKYLKTGSGTKNRWGDYSSTCIDPDDFSFWTIQEFADNPVASVDQWNTEWNHVVPPVPDLFVKDRVEDVGAEPEVSALPMWQSDDIWLRKTQDAAHAFAHITEDAEFRTGTSNPDYIYVEVRNRGAAASAGTEKLILYWAKASTGLSWPNPWNGGIYFDPGPNTMLMGNIIGTVNLPVIAAGGNTILEFPWNTPDPGLYATAFGGDQNHFCLLARVTTSTTTPFGMTFPETTGLYANVQNNNNIAWKNIEVYNLLPGTGAPAFAVIANLTDQSMMAKIRFSAMDSNGNPLLLQKGKLRVTAGGKLLEALKKNPPAGEGIKDIGNGQFEIITEDAFIQHITLNAKDFGTLKIEYFPNDGNEKLTGYALTITQIEEKNGGEQILGGQTAVFGKVAGFGTSPGETATNNHHWPWWYWILIILAILVILGLLFKKKK